MGSPSPAAQMQLEEEWVKQVMLLHGPALKAYATANGIKIAVAMTEFAGGNAAVVVYTCRSKFSYKGTPNDDIAKFSATMEKVDGTWKMVHNHRGTGQAPE